MEPRCVRASDLEFPDAPLDRAETPVGFAPELLFEVPTLAERQVYIFVEVLAGLTIVADHLVGHQVGQVASQLMLQRLIPGGQLDP